MVIGSGKDEVCNVIGLLHCAVWNRLPLRVKSLDFKRPLSACKVMVNQTALGLPKNTSLLRRSESELNCWYHISVREPIKHTLQLIAEKSPLWISYERNNRSMRYYMLVAICPIKLLANETVFCYAVVVMDAHKYGCVHDSLYKHLRCETAVLPTSACKYIYTIPMCSVIMNICLLQHTAWNFIDSLYILNLNIPTNKHIYSI